MEAKRRKRLMKFFFTIDHDKMILTNKNKPVSINKFSIAKVKEDIRQ